MGSLLVTEASSRLGILLGSTLPLATPPVLGAWGAVASRVRKYFHVRVFQPPCTAYMYVQKYKSTTFMPIVDRKFCRTAH